MTMQAIEEWEVVAPGSSDVRELPDPRETVRAAASQAPAMRDIVIRVAADEDALKKFYNISFSKTRALALSQFYKHELSQLALLPFSHLAQDARVDYLLLKQYIRREIRRLELQAAKNGAVLRIVPFASSLIDVLEARQNVSATELEPKLLARNLDGAAGLIRETRDAIDAGRVQCDRMAGLRTVQAVQELRGYLREFHQFMSGYDPLFDWWVAKPYGAVVEALDELVPIIEIKLAGMKPGDKDEIIGDAIGREGLLAELEAEVIPYTPEELLTIANKKFAWCEAEAKKASRELGFGDDWKAGLEHVKTMYVGPGEQPAYVKGLVMEGAEYVKSRNLVTVPAVAEQTWRMSMMPPADQKINPFFLGGPKIIVSYPTSDMSHTDKTMIMRGNNKPMARATAFHEMIPGHHLQLFMSARHRPYRRLFTTPFYVEGWAMYWEMVFWNNGDFFVTPEDRIGTLFWRMHRCARIIFSLNFHLGRMTPQECVDLLVDMVGHERATAEGEVRRSLNGDYSPLYQAGYMLGALQMYSLRSEVLETKLMAEKEFHDRILRASEMPIEMLRALLLNKDLPEDYRAQWKFEGDLKQPALFRSW